MPRKRHDEDLGQLLAGALTDAFTRWHKTNDPNEDPRDAYALWVRQIALYAHFAPGQGSWCIVEVEDRRRGRGTTEHYMLNERQRKLSRKISKA
jgi:hypothetical protein